MNKCRTVLAAVALTAGVKGTLLAAIPFAENVMVHLDASDESTMTVDPVTKEVTEWRSVETSTTKFIAPAPITIAGASYATGIPYLVEEDGRNAVWLGGTKDGSPTNYLMAADGVIKNPKTVVAVVRPHVAKSYYTLFGLVTGSGMRFMRSSGAEAAWNPANWEGSRYLNLVKDKTAFDDAGGFVTPHVVTGSRSENGNVEVLGGGYLWQSTAKPPKASADDVYAHASLHELVFYNRVLTDDELMDVQIYLMAKWGIGSISVWQGGGATTDWGDDGNWVGGRVPTSDSVVQIPSGAEITADGDCAAKQILAKGATLTMTAAARLDVRDGGIQNLTISGKGAVTCHGFWDLAGQDCSVGSLVGNGMMTNSSAATVTLTVENAGAAELSLYVAGPVNLVKRGEGTLAVAGPQGYAGSTTVEAGKLTASPDLAYGRYGNLTVRLDASRPEQLTFDADGNVARWDSFTGNGLSYEAGATAYPDAKFSVYPPYTFTDASGRASVRFGLSRDNVKTGTCMKASIPMLNQTIFVVHRPHNTWDGAFFGNLYSIPGRIYHASNATYNPTAGWINGVFGDPCCYADVGGDAAPHVAVFRKTACETSDVLGVAWAQVDGPNGKVNQLSVYGKMDLHEMLVFDEALTDDEIVEISSALVEKWSLRKWPDVELPAVSGWSAGSDYSIAAGASVDFGAADPQVGSLGGSGTVTAGGNLSLGGSSSVPGALTISCAGRLDLGGSKLVVRGVDCAITNTSGAMATLTVDTDERATLSQALSGNIALEKSGAGELLVLSRQAYEGETVLHGGALRVVPSLDLGKFNRKLSFHLDASCAETITTNADGDVMKWVSLTDNDVNFRPADQCYDASYPFRRDGYARMMTDDNGYPCARFGAGITGKGGENVCSLLCSCVGDQPKTATAMTLFFVNRPLDVRSNSNTLFGLVTSAAARCMRKSGADYQWNPLNMFDGWISGEHQFCLTNELMTALDFSTSAGIEGPHVLTVVQSSTQKPANMKFDCIGAAYLQKNMQEATDPNTIGGRFDLYEAFGFEEELTEAEIREITAYLVAKWGVKTADGVSLDLPRDYLPVGTTCRVTGDATLNLGGLQQQLNGFAFVADEEEGFPLLTVLGSYAHVLDLTDMALTLEAAEPVEVRQTLLHAPDATVAGPFATVGGLGSGAHLRYREHDVGYSVGGILMIVR